jgi:hypothetical protein
MRWLRDAPGGGYRSFITLSAVTLYDQLVALRSSLSEHRWQSRVDQPIVNVFNELLAAAQKLSPEPEALRGIERLKVRVSAATLLMLVDQMLVALGG